MFGSPTLPLWIEPELSEFIETRYPFRNGVINTFILRKCGVGGCCDPFRKCQQIKNQDFFQNDIKPRESLKKNTWSIDGQGIEGQGVERQGIEGQGIERQGIEGQGIEGQRIEGQGIERQGIE